MAREWTDLNDASSSGSGYELDDIDRLFRPDREPPLAPFGLLDENPLGVAAEGGSHPPFTAPGAGSSYAAAEMAPVHLAAEGLAIPHDGGTNMAGPSDAAACAETVALHGAFMSTWAALAATASIEGDVGQGLAAVEDTSGPAHGASFGGLFLGSAHGLAMLDLAPGTFEPGGMMTASIGSGQGDAAMYADFARSTFGVDGTGIKIGVLSDSFNELGGAVLDEADGNLPPASQVHVLLEDPFAGGTDEGRAMMEVIHDVAPNASLDFYSGVGSQQAVVNGIAALKADGCNIIVDDVAYLDEPFFQDDAISQEIHNVVAQDTPYFTAAGNDAANAYQSSFHPVTATMPDGTVVNNAQNFNFGGGPAVAVQNVTIGAGATITFTLQWDEAYGHSATDMAFRIYQSGVFLGSVDKFSSSISEPSNPFVTTGPLFNPNSVPVTIQVAVDTVSGPNPSLIKYMALGDGQPVSIDNFVTNSSTIFGHRMPADADTVGADLYTQTPRFGVSPPQLEFYSSAGPSEILFDSSGNRLASPEIINKVDFTAPDGISTSVPGGLGVFRGTSAAAPDAAAVAALMLQANPALNPQDITNLLRDSSIDMGPPGFDNATGAGLIQATAAVLGAEGAIQASNNQFLVEGTHLNDVFYGGPGNHFLDGCAGTNTLDYGYAPAGVTIDADHGTAVNGFGGTDRFANFQVFVGSTFNDVFYGGPGSNFYSGLGGTNTLDYGFAPAGVTVDAFHRTAGNGFGGTDGFAGIQVFIGSTFNDTFIGGPGSNFYSGLGGIDALIYWYAPAGVTIDADHGTAVNGFGGTDGFANIHVFLGSASNDVFMAGPGSNSYNGLGGTNTLDYGYAPAGVTIDADHGTASNGFGGTDGFANMQVFIGSTFNDTFIGGPGSNFYSGLGGIDALVYWYAPAGVTIDADHGTAVNGFGGTDGFANIHVFLGSASNDVFMAGPGSNYYDGLGGTNTLDYRFAPAGVTVDADHGTAANGFGGTDGFAGIQVFVGSSFNDVFYGGPGNDSYNGLGGTNTLDYGFAPAGVTIDADHGTASNGFGGTDGFANFQVFVGSSFNDTFIGGPGSNFYSGLGGTNTLDYRFAPAGVTIDAGHGTAANGFGGTDGFADIHDFVGSGFNDTLIGGPTVNATFTGGGGNNTFVFKDGYGAETITDFTASTGNVLDLSGVSQFHTFSDIQAHWAQVGGDVVIMPAGDSQIIIHNTTTAYLSAHQSEFIP